MPKRSDRPTVHLVVGARPNFMKVAPLVRALRAQDHLDWKLVHTGQHHDHAMSGAFFDELGIPPPDVQFQCGGGSHTSQTVRTMEAFEAHCLATRPAAVVVVGDVNATLACALVASKAGIPLAHVEAGLRSGDRSMPEEVNRVLTDAISDWLFVTEPAGLDNLRREGQPDARLFHVGHVMVDNLLHQVGLLQATDVRALAAHHIRQQVGGDYGVVTLHRPSNVDDDRALARLVDALNRVASALPLVFAVHPRTRARLDASGLRFSPRVHLVQPQGYMSFLHLWRDARLVLTDSGGLQEETTALGVPCLTLRDSTERPITVEQGSNTLAGTDPDRIEALALRSLGQGRQPCRRPALWDGKAAERIVGVLGEALQ